MGKLTERYKNSPKQVKAALWFLICSFLQRGISVLTTPIFTRVLTTAEYGQYSTFNSWMSIITIFITFNLYSGVYTQGLIKNSDDRDVYSSTMEGLMTTLVACGTVAYLLFRNFWNSLFSLTTAQMLCMLVMIWATAAYRFWAAEQRVLLTYKRLVAVTLIASCARPVLSLILVLTASYDKVTARVLGLAIVDFAAFIGLYYIQMRRGKKFFSGPYWKNAILFHLPLIPHYLSQTVLSSADRIMIRSMVGSSEAGIYGLAYSVSQIMLLFNSALTQTLSPWIYQKIKDKKVQDIHGIAYGSLLLIAAVNLLLMALAPEVIRIFAPESYYAAIYVIPPVSMSVIFIFCYDLFAKFAFYYERTKFVMVASIIAASANIVLNLIFIPMFGYVAAGYTTLACYMIYAVAHYLFMNRVCKLDMDGERPYKTRILIAIIAVFMALGFYFLFTYNFPILRYASLAVMVVVLILLRKRIRSLVDSLMNMRRDRRKS